MFKKETESNYSHEVLQGLFGELYFIKHYMLDKYDAKTAIQAWSGAEKRSKDFSVNTEWFEIKTIGANENKVEISSLAQLSSENIGHLVIIRVEAMSDEFNNGESCIGDLLKSIMGQINDETVEGNLILFYLNTKLPYLLMDVFGMLIKVVNGLFPQKVIRIFGIINLNIIKIVI